VATPRIDDLTAGRVVTGREEQQAPVSKVRIVSVLQQAQAWSLTDLPKFGCAPNRFQAFDVLRS